MIVRAALIALALCIPATPSVAQPLFGNPFADAAAYRAERSELSEARYRVRYEFTRIEHGGAPQIGELAIDVASDWALVREGDRLTLHDFRLNRVFALAGDSFTTTNGLAFLTFRIMERQNRGYLQRVLAAAGAQGELPDACDAESELGLAIPGAADAGVTNFRERRGAITLRCAGRDIGSFTLGNGAVAPPAFWPTMYAEMLTHPALHRRMRETGRAPALIETLYRDGTGGPSRRSWRLIGADQVSVAYPLDPSLRNATASLLDQLVPGAGQVGGDAVAGRAQGGAPTFEMWDQHLRTLSAREGEAAAAMLLGATYNMFPETQCDAGQPYAVCDLIRRVRNLDDQGPWAQFEVVIGEQERNPAAALAAMQRAQVSQHRDHPTLGATFALALLQFNRDQLAEAGAAGLPTDVAALQNRALLALPYNPAYWTDVGDRFGRDYDWLSAFMFFDVAYSLPMPSAVANNQALADKRRRMERIRRDYPDAFLPRP